MGTGAPIGCMPEPGDSVDRATTTASNLEGGPEPLLQLRWRALRRSVGELISRLRPLFKGPTCKPERETAALHPAFQTFVPRSVRVATIRALFQMSPDMAALGA